MDLKQSIELNQIQTSTHVVKQWSKQKKDAQGHSMPMTRAQSHHVGRQTQNARYTAIKGLVSQSGAGPRRSKTIIQKRKNPEMSS